METSVLVVIMFFSAVSTVLSIISFVYSLRYEKFRLLARDSIESADSAISIAKSLRSSFGKRLTALERGGGAGGSPDDMLANLLIQQLGLNQNNDAEPEYEDEVEEDED